MKNRQPEIALVLAAGKGSRMGLQTTPKVCLPVDGTPAIVRALQTYRECGIRQNLVVVGTMAGQVVDMVGRAFPNTAFAYQPRTDGTAGAVRAALWAVPLLSPDADILIVAGDRIIDPPVIEALMDLYQREDCDLALLALPTESGSGSGRIVRDGDGNVLGILEMPDVRQRRCRRLFRELEGAAVQTADLRKLALERFSAAEGKCAAAFPEIWSREGSIGASELRAIYPEESCLFQVEDRTLAPEQVEALPLSNTSVYVTKKKNLEYVLSRLDRDNAQQEEYLSDIVRLLRRREPPGRIVCLVEKDREKVLGFNDPQELLRVSSVVHRRNQRECPAPDPALFQPVEDYVAQVRAALAGDQDLPLYHYCCTAYGQDKDIIAGHLRKALPLLELARRDLPPGSPVALVRSPGRVNVMGRHVDRQGGNCNLMTINFETLLAVHPRKDDAVRLRHLDPESFRPADFTISELVGELPWEDWLSVVNSRKLKELIGTYGVDWTHYIKAAVLRLQKKYRTTPLHGMDLFVSGDVPMAAGLSSSSSLVVGAAEAVIAVNQLDTFPAQLVSLCGEGEWFVGTRGGAADHAAVKLGSRNKVVKVAFYDFAVEGEYDFPRDHAMVICDSGVKARKSGNARNQFNHRIACYDLGFRLLKRQYPQYAPLLGHLRDVNSRNLQVNPARIYEMMLSLPEKATRSELEDLLREDLAEVWSTHDEPADGVYPVRSVVLFGLAESARSRIYSDLLEKHDLAGIGRLMKISHDGDRVSRLNAAGVREPWSFSCSNRSLLALMEDLRSGDVERVKAAQLCNVPGGYGCSVPEIDAMVDIADGVPGVVGAQLAGAGLGGCMMILTHRDAIPALRKALIENYYQKENIPPAIYECRPISGSETVRLDS